MNEWTEQEEQEIIARAKTGDPEANYALSLWALRRSEEEPDEPRWNRLAAKCLVKAAQAGYGPAKEQMEALLHQDAQPVRTARQSPPPASPEPEEDGEDEADEEEPVRPRHAARQTAPVRQTTPRRSQPARQSPPSRQNTPNRRRRAMEQDDAGEGYDTQDDWDDTEDEDDVPAGRGFGLTRGFGRPGRSAGQSGGRKWSDDQWRRMEFICVFVCAALLVLIAVMILTGRHGGSDSGSGGSSSIPAPGEVGSAQDAGGTTVGDYPDAATLTAIMAADLDIQPAPEDYVTEPTVGTVSVGSVSLRLRKGPNVTYDEITTMPNGSNVSVFAKKNDWALVLYQGDEGPVYGWCSSEYVILTAAGAGGVTPTSDPNAAG